ncbi:hypothetical protein EF384_05285 [Aerococcus agrisoli]|uniref:Uncharacterized protein n=1 Tax=Aerococcus agrisoli TaxID=2487350 RepID=A0A3N4GGN3_9LACT|nr:hypothetical protein [Aerococcus agrisoli]RPA60577.1 hypothetical protein EF384_05285 [Aerococcus agrisoli]
MKTPKVVMGLLTATVLVAGYTISQVQADEQANAIYETSQVAASSEASSESAVAVSETASQASTQASDVSASAEVETSEVAETETTTTEASAESEAVITEAQASAETPVAETTTDVEDTATEVAPTTDSQATEASLPDQSENRQIIIDRLGLASDALDAYSDAQIAQSRAEAEALGSDPGYSYSWLLSQTPANASTQSM